MQRKHRQHLGNWVAMTAGVIIRAKRSSPLRRLSSALKGALAMQLLQQGIRRLLLVFARKLRREGRRYAVLSLGGHGDEIRDRSAGGVLKVEPS